MTAKAPVCEVNSFSSGTLYGWGGFTNVNPITHSSYVNPNLKPDDNSKTFGVLHWPRGIDKKEVMKFTDITRKYSIQDGLQNTDGDGNTLVWPNQMEYNKAYLQGSHGYLWNAWSTTEWVEPTSEKKVADELFENMVQILNMYSILRMVQQIMIRMSIMQTIVDGISLC